MHSTAWEERASEEAPPLDLSEATELVGAVSRQLDGMLDTPADEDPPFKRLQAVLRRMSVKNQRTLARAGACEMLASALDRAVRSQPGSTGQLSPVSLHDIVSCMMYLAGNSVKNKAALGQLGAIASLTATLRHAIQKNDVPLVMATVALLGDLAESRVSSFCEAFGSAGAFEAAAECVAWAAATPSPDKVGPGKASSPRTSACALLVALQAVADACTRPGCGNRARLVWNGPLFTACRGSRHRLFTALDACLSDAVAAAEFLSSQATATPAPTGSHFNPFWNCRDLALRGMFSGLPASARGGLARSLLQGAATDLTCVCAVINALIAAGQDVGPARTHHAVTTQMVTTTPTAHRFDRRQGVLAPLVRYAASGRPLRRWWFYGDVARSLASPLVCDNLVRVLALARSPLWAAERAMALRGMPVEAATPLGGGSWAHERDAMLQGATTSLVDPLPLHALVGDVAWMIYTLCEAHDHAAPFQTHIGCSHLVHLLWAANQECAGKEGTNGGRNVAGDMRQHAGTHTRPRRRASCVPNSPSQEQNDAQRGPDGVSLEVQEDALSAIWAVARNDMGAAQLHAVGACDHLVQALRQGVERDDLDLVIFAARPLRRVITAVPDALGQLARNAYACWLLVKCAQMALARGGGGQAAPGRVGWPWPLICWVDFWWLMLSAHPACVHDFWAAGASDVLEQHVHRALASRGCHPSVQIYVFIVSNDSDEEDELDL
eukprot:jgi/Mesvir1/13881/Mv16017-RA.1